jgi:4-amino-4-deoxy-L-arabinose transferase-like glycosyltransferase
MSRQQAALAALVALITLYGALLRIDALASRYGWMEQPGWAIALEQRTLTLTRYLRPHAVPWGAAVPHPYVGGDPINYLRFAREMRHFYQAHVREPVFLAATRGFLWLTGGADVSVSFASALAGTLAIPATYLLGAAAWSPLAGLIAALALAMELEAVIWSVDGWRDDTFMLFVALTAWTFVRLRQRPSASRAALVGVAAAAACLTRITALSFVVPGLVWIVLESPAAARARMMRHTALAALICGALVAPFLVNCWRATGDPFFAINYHTVYYRAAEGQTSKEPVSALRYVTSKFVARPFQTIDTASVGIVRRPFVRNWTGFDHWVSGAGRVLQVCAAVGLVLALWTRDGRLLLILLLTSLIPYALTWPLGGGGEWRFTQHAYPFYLVAAGGALSLAASRVWALRAMRKVTRPTVPRRRLAQAFAVLLLLVIAGAVHAILPALVFREALASGDPATIAAGERDGVFFAGAWSPPEPAGTTTVRAALDERVAVRVPLPMRADYWLTIRMDPAETEDPNQQPRVTAFLNGGTIAQIRMRRDPVRMGLYRIAVPKELVGRRISRLDLVASHTVPAREAGPRFASLSADSRVAFRLWYVRVERK